MSTESKSNALEVTVTELSGKLKRTVEDTFGHVRVRGEISGYRGPHSSGHSYFSLKDEKARLEAVIWRGQASKLKHLPEEGLEVVASGKLTTYPGSSKYQIVIDGLEPAGAGALMALLEERRKKLSAEGLFDDARKQLLPYLPRVIGVITSPTGAVIRDILHRISDRFPVQVLVWPVRVQGETTGREVANAIHQLNNLPENGPLTPPDLIIVARGGGSLEDLWGFNDEVAVRAAADSAIPLISAVGHETDWTLIDYAADWRAPTPTAAAEKAVPVKAELQALIADLGARLRGSTSRLAERRQSGLRAATRGLKTPDMLLALPRRRFDEASGRLDRQLENRVRLSSTTFLQTASRLSPAILTRRILRAREHMTPHITALERAVPKLVERRRQQFDAAARQVRLAPLQQRLNREQATIDALGRRLMARQSAVLSSATEQIEHYERLLLSLSYKGVLARGFAVIRNKSGKTLQKTAGIKPGSELTVEMQDGNIQTIAGKRIDQNQPSPLKKPKAKSKTPSSDQGVLF